jgi:hypothetical protein
MPQFWIRDRKVDRSALVRGALGVALAAAVVCTVSATARAGDDDQDGASVIGRLMQSLGMKNPGGAYSGVNYSERSPLVVPPTRDLPPPVSGSAPPAPNWPKDADVERRKKAKKEDKPAYQKDFIVDSSRPLTPNELKSPGASSTNAPGDGDSSANSQMVDARDKGAKKSILSNLFKKEEYATFTGEPARETLTDPPPGYLTPSPDQPYGINSKATPYKVKTLGERMEPTR